MGGMFGMPMMPSKAALMGGQAGGENPKQTAMALDQSSERRRRRRMEASVLTRDWAKPKLGTPALFGMT
jgi:hypothetical protein